MSSITAEVHSEKPVADERPQCGFWRRLLAFFIDSVMLGVLGIILGLLFGKYFVKMGSFGSLIGFCIVVCYYGILNSHIGQGQTIGKKLLRIQVVDKNGNLITARRACLRAAILGVVACNGIITSSSIINHIISGIVWALFIGLLYFYLLNRKTRQSIHDILCGTYVYKLGRLNTPAVLSTARRHYAAYAVIVIVSYAALYIGSNYQTFSPLLENLNKIDGTYASNVKQTTTRQVFSPQDGLINGKTITAITATVYVYEKPATDEGLKDKIAKTVLEHYPDADDLQAITANVSYGYNIGIAHMYEHSWVSGTPQMWKQKLQIE